MLTIDAVEAALRRGPLTTAQLCRRFSVTRPTIYAHLRRLRDAGALVEVGSGNDREYAIAAKAVAS